MRFFLVATFCMASMILAAGAMAQEGSLSGRATMRYVHYQATSDGGGRDDRGHSFAQQYSLLYERSGALYQDRGGKYEIALGAEWTGISGSMNDKHFDADTFKLLYRGEVVFAPGGLPFQVRAYSRDMSSATTSTDDYWADNYILRPNLDTDILDGQHIQTAVTIIAGIRNGSYLGRYRDILSQFPRLLMDYSEDRVKDTKRANPVDYVARNLAFVSLNKKDNWFHYRFFDFVDNIDKSGQNDYNSKTYMLGTIDHMLQRQWINLTNWIRISADGSYTLTDYAREAAPERRYDVNLFSTAKRSTWRGANFTNFQRERTGRQLSKSLEVPLYLSGELNRDTAWRFSFVGTRENDFYFESGKNDEREVLFASSRIETQRYSRYKVAPEFEAELKQGDRGEGANARAGVEFSTNRLYNPRFNLFGAYSLASFNGTSKSGEDVSFWENTAEARVDTFLNPRLRTGFTEELVFGSGSIDSTVASRVSPKSGRPAPGSDTAATGLTSGQVLRSTTTLYAEHTISRLRNRLSVSYDYYDSGGDPVDLLSLTENMNYNRRALTMNMSNTLTFGKQASVGSVGNQTLENTATAEVDRVFRHESKLRYSPGRAWESTLRLDYEWRDADAGDTTLVTLQQEGRYNIYKTNGVVRKIVELGEELEYERFQEIDGSLRSVAVLTLRGSYFPTKKISLVGRIEYEDRSPGRDVLSLHLGAGLHYQKFTADLTYDYATSSGSLSDREEHRWDATVSKTF